MSDTFNNKMHKVKINNFANSLKDYASQNTNVQHIYSSQEKLATVANKIDKLLNYFEQDDLPASQVQQIIKSATKEQPEILNAEIVEQAIKTSPTLRQRIGAAGLTASMETIKMLLPPLGIAIEAVKAYRNSEAD